jgi:hypothetical protein
MKKAILLFVLSIFFSSEGYSQGLKINKDQYFEMPGLNVMVFYDIYPEGHQGAIGIIQNGTRVATNGDLRLEPTPGQWQPIPASGKREVFPDKNEISIKCTYPDESRNRKGFNPVIYPDLNFSYNVRVIGEGKKFRIIVDLEKPLPKEWIGKVGFNFELFPGNLFGKAWYVDGKSGIFARQPVSPMRQDNDGAWQASPMASGKKLTIAPDAPDQTMIITSLKSDIQLLDGRFYHNNGWYVVRSEVPEGAVKNAVEWVVEPNVVPNFKQKPVVHTSQVGYLPDQRKVANIELDAAETQIKKVSLMRLAEGGKPEVAKSALPVKWGKYLRFNYYQFDFSDVKKPGMYQLQYDNYTTEPFKIDNDVYQRGVWQPTLEYFYPVQMCHMRVNEGYRVWHGLCHMDDALMAPTDTNHYDGYMQGHSTLTRFKPYEQVPGLNIGGWHDAGDYDLRVESQAGAVHSLALLYEEFGLKWDQTTIDETNRVVEIHRPDGKPDVLQQIEHGVLTILGGYENLGRLYRGIIDHELRQYVLLGDGSTMTDGLKYNPKLSKPEKTGIESGSSDDRWVFTEENPGRELSTIPALAAAARVLKGYNDTLSGKCLKVALELYAKNNTASDSRGWGIAFNKVNAACELYLTTNDSKYLNDIYAAKETLSKNLFTSATYISRVWNQLKNEEFKSALLPAYQRLNDQVQGQNKQNPFGVPYHIAIWGDGWSIEQAGVQQYFLHKSFPNIFSSDLIFNSLDFVLGNHFGENTSSFVSGVGARSVTTAYGPNRGDWSSVPGGVVSGTGIIRPDFPELKVWPFMWQQTEYVIGAETTNFMFLVLAAEKLKGK